ncbi:MAG: hypothetical protein IKN79_07965 [Eubacterium sp.]|nr:hypothetical protein [Eubacterium sp.]
MKFSKKMTAAAILALGFLLSGCGDSGAASHAGNNQNAVENAVQKQIAAEENQQSSSGKKTEEVTEKRAEKPTEKPTEKQTEQKTEAPTEQKSTSAAANDRYDPFEGIDTSFISEPDPNVDVDLTAMNSEMVYATVLQMLNVPEDYTGKKIKMEGIYYTTYYDLTDEYYHYVIIRDATACCAQGLEFIWGDGSHVFPDEYPREESEVEVVGEFEPYFDEVDQMSYVHLKNSTLKVVAEAEEKSSEISFQY